MTKQYCEQNIRFGSNGEIYFCESVIEDYEDVFITYRTNYRVQQDLIDAGVLIDGNIGQSGGNVRVAFKSTADGFDFVNRLNDYVKRMMDLM